MFDKNYNTADNELACALLGTYLDNLLLKEYKPKGRGYEQKVERGEFDDKTDYFRLSDNWDSCMAELDLRPSERVWLTVENVSDLLLEKGADLTLLLPQAEAKVEARLQKRVAVENTSDKEVTAVSALSRTQTKVAA
jgi:hypothetical protein